ncbi:Crp/Fnr family transcriptional regulator [Bacillaceae bacterium S4-13-56]
MIPLLERLDSYDRDMLLGNSKPLTVTKGDFIFREGEFADKLFFIKKGQIRVFKQMKKNKEITVFIRQDLDSFGEIGIFSGNLYSNSAEAVTNCKLYYIEREHMETIMSQNGRLSLQVTKWLAESLEGSKAKLRDYLILGSEGAVASVFVRLSNMYGVITAEGIYISEPIMVQDIGKLVGISRETVSRIISKWKEQGVLDADQKYFIIKKIDYFEKMLICEKCGVQNCVL